MNVTLDRRRDEFGAGAEIEGGVDDRFDDRREVFGDPERLREDFNAVVEGEIGVDTSVFGEACRKAIGVLVRDLPPTRVSSLRFSLPSSTSTD